MRTHERALIAVAFACLVVNLWAGGSLPIVTPVDSPFPAEGAWLLVAAEATDLSGVQVSANAKSIRDITGENGRVHDYGETDLGAPWDDALSRAAASSGGKPYYIARNGRQASEGLLPAGVADQTATLEAALGVE